MRKVWVWLAVLFLLVSCFAGLFKVEPVKAQTWTYINTLPYTITESGNYKLNTSFVGSRIVPGSGTQWSVGINITVSNVVLDCQNKQLQQADSYSTVRNINAINIENLEIYNYYGSTGNVGIYITSVNNFVLRDSTVYAQWAYSGWGAYFVSCSNIRIQNVTSNGDSYYGFVMFYATLSSYVYVLNCTHYSSYRQYTSSYNYAVYTYQTNNINIDNLRVVNIAYEKEYSRTDIGVYIYSSVANVDIRNSYFDTRSDGIVLSPSYLGYSYSNITITDNVFIKNYNGSSIQIPIHTQITISNNLFSNCIKGLDLAVLNVTATFSNNTFNNCQNAINLNGQSGKTPTPSNFYFNNFTFSNCQTGIYIKGYIPTVEITACTFTSTTTGIYATAYSQTVGYRYSGNIYIYENTFNSGLLGVNFDKCWDTDSEYAVENCNFNSLTTAVKAESTPNLSIYQNNFSTGTIGTQIKTSNNFWIEKNVYTLYGSANYDGAIFLDNSAGIVYNNTFNQNYNGIVWQNTADLSNTIQIYNNHYYYNQYTLGVIITVTANNLKFANNFIYDYNPIHSYYSPLGITSTELQLNTTRQSGTRIYTTGDIGGNAWLNPYGTGYSQTSAHIGNNFCAPYNIFGISGTFVYDYLPYYVGGSSATPTPTPTPTTTPTPTYNPSTSPTPPILIQKEITTVDLYFRGDTYTTLGTSGYGLDETPKDGADVYLTLEGEVTVSIGWRVWLYGESGERELTNGTPEAVVTTNSNTGYVESTWLAPNAYISFGYDAIKVVAYISTDGENWQALTQFVTNPILSNWLISSSWTFRYILTVTQTEGNTILSMEWGIDAVKQSGVSGVQFEKASATDVKLFKLMNFDILGFLLYDYVQLFGGLFYVILLVAILGAYYIWHGKMSVVLFMLVLFGSAGGLIWVFIPSPVNILLWFAMAVFMAVLLFRVFR